MTTIISLDCEANGLHGGIFAVAAVLYVDGREVTTWTARCPVLGSVDPWVYDNVLSAIADMPVTADGYRDLVHGWRSWYRQARDEFGPEVRVLCHVPWPIEARFLWDAHHEIPFSGPFPLLDLASMLHARGHDPTSEDAFLRSVGLERPAGMAHDPLNDARAAAAAYFALVADDEPDPSPRPGTFVVTSAHRLLVGAPRERVPKTEALDLAQAFYRDEVAYAARALADIDAGRATVEHEGASS